MRSIIAHQDQHQSIRPSSSPSSSSSSSSLSSPSSSAEGLEGLGTRTRTRSKRKKGIYHSTPSSTSKGNLDYDRVEDQAAWNKSIHPTSTHNHYHHHRHQQHSNHHPLNQSILSPSTSSSPHLLNISQKTPQLTFSSNFWSNALINTCFILSWYLFATLISLYNKWMFSPDHYNFQFPLFVSSCHMYIQFGLSALTLFIFPSIRSKTKPTPNDYLKKALPCGLASGLDIGLSNTSLKTVTLSFYTMCKSSSLAFVLMFAFIFKLEKPTYKLTGIIMMITAGVILMVSSETKFEFWGMIEVLSASCLGGLRWSLTQILLDKQSMGMNTPIATIFWLAPTMGLSLSFCSIIFEGWSNLLSQEAFFGDLAKSLMTMTYIMSAGILAFLMTVSEYFLIQRTSVVTLSIAGVFKEVGTIFLSTIIFHDVMTPLNISGLAITLLGIGFYNVLKYQQSLKGSSSNEEDKEGLIVLMNRKEESQAYSKLNEHKPEEEQDDEGDECEVEHEGEGGSYKDDEDHQLIGVHHHHYRHGLMMSERSSNYQTSNSDGLLRGNQTNVFNEQNDNENKSRRVKMKSKDYHSMKVLKTTEEGSEERKNKIEPIENVHNYKEESFEDQSREFSRTCSTPSYSTSSPNQSSMNGSFDLIEKH